MVHSLPLNAPPPHDLEEARPVASCNRCSLPQRGEGTQLVTGLCVDIPPRSLQFKCPQFLPHCCALIYSSSVLQFIVYHCTAGGGRWGIILRAISWFFFFFKKSILLFSGGYIEENSSKDYRSYENQLLLVFRATYSLLKPFYV